jgi:phosphatidylinositol alpha-mannosyltransferase
MKSECRPRSPARSHILAPVKVGIVVPFSWSYWGGVNEHAFHQARALERLGIETRTIIGHDPPGRLTSVLHPRAGRHDRPPADVIPIGRSVIVPANSSLPNIVLSPSAIVRIRRLLKQERFDVIHVHEPMTPATCVASLVWARCPIVATHHAAGDLGWLALGQHMWGFLMDRIDYRIAVSEQARDSAARWFPGHYDIIPNGVQIPATADATNRADRIVFIGRHDPRKGLEVLLQAWPEIHRRTGARLRIIGADPLAVGLLLARHRIPQDAIDILGFVDEDELTREVEAAQMLVAPSLGQESFGMVLTRAFACATPVVASDIPGYAAVMTPDTGVLVPPGDIQALADAVSTLSADPERRRTLGEAARQVAIDRYSWDDIGRRLATVYEGLARTARDGRGAAA